MNSFLIENVFSVASEQELILSFRPRDQKKLIVPQNLKFPLTVRSYLTWKESSGVYTYLIFKAPNWDMPKGIAFKRTAPTGEHMGGLCSWCNAYGASDEIGMLSININSTVSASYLLCQDLRCIEKIEEAAALSGKSPEKWMAQLYHKIAQLFEGLNNYKAD